MLLVKTKIGPSKIHGIGLFTDQFIKKGTKVWAFTPGFDQRFTKEQIISFPDLVQIYFAKYSWFSNKSRLYCLSSDNGKYFNHSNNPNVLSKYLDFEEEVITTAIRDILPGEEITDNYSSFESINDKDNILDELFSKYRLVDEVDPRLKPQ